MDRPPLTSAHWLPDRSLPLIEGSVADLLRRNAVEYAGRTALFWPTDDGMQSMTHAELLRRSGVLAEWLLERARPGDRIATWSRNALNLVFVHHAAALAGMIITPFNTGWADPEVRHADGLAKPVLMFAGVDNRGQDLTERVRPLVSCEVVPLERVPDLTPSRDLPLPQVSPDAPYLIQFTSGTTGRAKAALVSHRAAILGGWMRAAMEGGDADDVILNPVPFHHIGGSCFILVGAAAFGCANVVLERYDARQLAALMKPMRATRMGGVPTIWFDLLRQPDLPSDSYVKVVTLGGASVAPQLVQQVRAQLGARCAISYGQSECTIATFTRPDDTDEVLTETVGRPAPHVEIKVVDASGRTVAPDEIGEIWVRGPTCMIGYFGDEAATAAAFTEDGFLKTGDLGSMDADGVCRIRGRAREVIIRGGENIYPPEIENVLLEHPSIASAAVFGLDDERLGQKVAAAVTLRPGAELQLEALRDFVAGAVSHFKVPAVWRVMESLPMTASGKVRKHELVQMVGDA
jgi:fatty-acyl-CoA synthase